VSEGSIGDGACGSSTNYLSQKHDNSDTCVKNMSNGHLPNLESDTEDVIETSTSMVNTNVDSMCEDNRQSDVADDTDVSDVRSTTDDVMQLPPNENCKNTDEETRSSDAVCDSNEHATAARSEVTLEQTDCTSSVEGRDLLHGKEPDQSLHHDCSDKTDAESTGDARLDLSPALTNEVNRH